MQTIVGGNDEDEESKEDYTNYSSLPMHQPTAIDAILIFDTAKDQRNNLVHS